MIRPACAMEMAPVSSKQPRRWNLTLQRYQPRRGGEGHLPFGGTGRMPLDDSGITQAAAKILLPEMMTAAVMQRGYWGRKSASAAQVLHQTGSIRPVRIYSSRWSKRSRMISAPCCRADRRAEAATTAWIGLLNLLAGTFIGNTEEGTGPANPLEGPPKFRRKG